MITKRLTLLLFIGMAWGQSLKLVNTDGQSVIIKPSQGTLISLPTTGLFNLNGTNYVLFDVDYKAKTVRVKKYNRTNIGRMINYFNYKEIPFTPINSFRYIKQRFSVIPILIGGGIWYYNMVNPKADILSIYLGTIPAVSLGLYLSNIPQFSEQLIVGDDNWIIKNN